MVITGDFLLQRCLFPFVMGYNYSVCMALYYVSTSILTFTSNLKYPSNRPELYVTPSSRGQFGALRVILLNHLHNPPSATQTVRRAVTALSAVLSEKYNER